MSKDSEKQQLVRLIQGIAREVCCQILDEHERDFEHKKNPRKEEA